MALGQRLLGYASFFYWWAKLSENAFTSVVEYSQERERQ